MKVPLVMALFLDKALAVGSVILDKKFKEDAWHVWLIISSFLNHPVNVIARPWVQCLAFSGNI